MPEYNKTVRDVDGDPAKVESSSRWDVVGLTCEVGEDRTTLALAPAAARRLARALRRAARVAEGKPARKAKTPRAPKVGARVRVLTDNAHHAYVAAGDLGTVHSIEGDADGNFLCVVMDTPHPRSHRSHGRAFDWYFRPSDVAVIR